MRHRGSLLSGCLHCCVGGGENEQESVCTVIKIKRGLGLAVCSRWPVGKDPSEVTLGDTQLLPLKNGGYCVCGSGTEQRQRNGEIKERLVL